MGIYEHRIPITTDHRHNEREKEIDPEILH